jgi:hypothetical protein
MTMPSSKWQDLFTRIKAFCPQLGHFQPAAGGVSRLEFLIGSALRGDNDINCLVIIHSIKLAFRANKSPIQRNAVDNILRFFGFASRVSQSNGLRDYRSIENCRKDLPSLETMNSHFVSRVPAKQNALLYDRSFYAR